MHGTRDLAGIGHKRRWDFAGLAGSWGSGRLRQELAATRTQHLIILRRAGATGPASGDYADAVVDGIRTGPPGSLSKKTLRSRRTIVAPNVVMEALAAHKARQAQEQLLAGPRWRSSGLVFMAMEGGPLDAAVVRRRFPRLLRKAGLAAMPFHNLRHSCASLLLAQGVPARVVMETLGHSNISLPLNTYSHVAAELMREAAELMREAAEAMDRALG